MDPRATTAARATGCEANGWGTPRRNLRLIRGGRALGPALRLVRRDGVPRCVPLAAPAVHGLDPLAGGAVARRVDPEPYGFTVHEDLAMTAFYCPRSGLQLAVDVHRHDENPFDDLDLEVP